MTVSTSGYTLGSNQPLHHTRILWDFVTGTSSGFGGGSYDLAANDYTNQRWEATNTPASAGAGYQLIGASQFDFDTVIIAAHNLHQIGVATQVWTAPELVAPFTWTQRASVTPTDGRPIAFMMNNAGSPRTVGTVRVQVPAGGVASPKIGIVRIGVALQMPRPLGQGAEPIGLRSVKDVRQMDSETGQWLGRTVQRRRQEATIGWPHLDAAWYRANFAPFADTLPERPFGLIQNAVSMPESVAWCWTNDDPRPSYTEGKRVSFSMSLVGFDG